MTEIEQLPRSMGSECLANIILYYLKLQGYYHRGRLVEEQNLYIIPKWLFGELAC